MAVTSFYSYELLHLLTICYVSLLFYLAPVAASASENDVHAPKPPTAPQTKQQKPTALQVGQQRLQAQGGALRPPSRKVAGGQGTLGCPISLSANHFAVTLKNSVVYHYDVDIKPEPSKTLFGLLFIFYIVFYCSKS